MKCLLHIGTEKTGTTMLQTWLYLNRAALSAQGVALSDVLGTPSNRLLSAYFQTKSDDFDRNHNISTPQQKVHFFDGFEDRVRSEIQDAARTHHTMVISSEHLHSRLRTVEEIAALARFLTENFSSVRIVCYFREQSEVRKSLYSTAIRSGFFGKIEKFQREIDPDMHYYNYAVMFGKWADAFGSENLEPAIYDRNVFASGDLRIDFLTRVHQSIRMDALDYSATTPNEKLSALQAELCRAVNHVFPRYNRDGSLNATRQMLRRRILNSPDLNLGAIEDPDQLRVYDLFDASNRAFSRRFLGHNENPFARPKAPANPDSYTVPLNRIEDILFSCATALARRHPVEPGLCDSDADVLRDVALKHETGQAPTKDEAVALMRLAQIARPTGPRIGQKLSEWLGEP